MPWLIANGGNRFALPAADLTVAPDATYIDTTAMPIDRVVATVLDLVKNKTH